MVRFGMDEAEAAAQPSLSGKGGAYMKRPKAGENIWRICDEPDAWVYFWEHFDENFSYPCTRDRATCPGCTSDNPKVAKCSQKVAFNINDGEYTNVAKVPKLSVADKLKSRFERIGTLKDRDYLIRQTKTQGGTDYDVEGLEKEPFDYDAIKEFILDRDGIDQMLANDYENAWGDSAMTTKAREKKEEPPKWVTGKDSRFKKDKPKVEEDSIKEGDLRKMDTFELLALCKEESLGDPPKGVETPDQIVDWMLDAS